MDHSGHHNVTELHSVHKQTHISGEPDNRINQDRCKVQAEAF